jgi:hypothetical protein
MTTTTLIRRADSVLWELRRFWASGRRVALSLTEDGGRRIEGQVTAVSPTGAWIKVNGVQLRPEQILAVHRPVILGEDSTWRGGAWHFESRWVIPQAEELPGIREMLAA